MTTFDETAQILIERKAHSIQCDIHDLIKARTDNTTSHHLEALEAQLLASLSMLQFLCSDLRESRKAKFIQAAE